MRQIGCGPAYTGSPEHLVGMAATGIVPEMTRAHPLLHLSDLAARAVVWAAAAALLGPAQLGRPRAVPRLDVGDDRGRPDRGPDVHHRRADGHDDVRTPTPSPDSCRDGINCVVNCAFMIHQPDAARVSVAGVLLRQVPGGAQPRGVAQAVRPHRVRGRAVHGRARVHRGRRRECATSATSSSSAPPTRPRRGAKTRRTRASRAAACVRRRRDSLRGTIGFGVVCP